MKRDVLRGSVALILALIGGLAQGSLPARAALASPNLYLVQAQHLTTMLAPGATIQIVARDLPPAPHGYCLGLSSPPSRRGPFSSMQGAVRLWRQMVISAARR